MKNLREVQNRFLECLDLSGFHARNKDSMTTPLFDKGSPTAIQVSRELYPQYREQFLGYIEEYDKKISFQSRSSQTRSQPRKHASSGDEDAEEGETDP